MLVPFILKFNEIYVCVYIFQCLPGGYAQRNITSCQNILCRQQSFKLQRRREVLFCNSCCALGILLYIYFSVYPMGTQCNSVLPLARTYVPATIFQNADKASLIHLFNISSIIFFMTVLNDPMGPSAWP